MWILLQRSWTPWSVVTQAYSEYLLYYILLVPWSVPPEVDRYCWFGNWLRWYWMLLQPNNMDNSSSLAIWFRSFEVHCAFSLKNIKITFPCGVWVSHCGADWIMNSHWADDPSKKTFCSAAVEDSTNAWVWRFYPAHKIDAYDDGSLARWFKTCVHCVWLPTKHYQVWFNTSRRMYWCPISI